MEYYPSDDILIRYIRQYIIDGLNKGDICIIIGETKHNKEVKHQIIAKGYDIQKLAKSQQLIFLDARETLDSFMEKGRPNKDLFLKNVGRKIQSAVVTGSHVRAFGSMVALLWRDGNPEAVVQLEKYWNDLAEIVDFSLFCAYPSEEFSGNDDYWVRSINRCHAMTI